MTSFRDVIGIIPAGGSARRLGGLPVSKEILPVGYELDGNEMRVFPACKPLIHAMQKAGAGRVMFSIRRGKWDIPDFLGNGARYSVSLAYVVVSLPNGVPFSIDEAYEYIRNQTVVFGFPDILHDNEDLFIRLIQRLEARGEWLVLACFPVQPDQAGGIVVFDDEGRAVKIDPHITENPIQYAWIAAAWSHQFTEYIHDFVDRRKEEITNNPDLVDHEWTISDAVNSAINDDIPVGTVLFPETGFLDIGTPEGLKAAFSWMMDHQKQG